MFEKKGPNSAGFDNLKIMLNNYNEVQFISIWFIWMWSGSNAEVMRKPWGHKFFEPFVSTQNSGFGSPMTISSARYRSSTSAQTLDPNDHSPLWINNFNLAVVQDSLMHPCELQTKTFSYWDKPDPVKRIRLDFQSLGCQILDIYVIESHSLCLWRRDRSCFVVAGEHKTSDWKNDLRNIG
jgi:hypothetical protein